jgi:ketosteroid isomerase-like protein
MTRNKLTVERYMDAFRRTDHAQVLTCLTDDVEWRIPGAFHARGKDAFDTHIESPEFLPHPDITVARLIEEDDVVVAEGTVRTQKIDGTVLRLAFCDLFEMQNGRIRRLISYLMPASDAGEPPAG